jgi:hypothetical protein
MEIAEHDHHGKIAEGYPTIRPTSPLSGAASRSARRWPM